VHRNSEGEKNDKPKGRDGKKQAKKIMGNKEDKERIQKGRYESKRNAKKTRREYQKR
jgi:hypothetical protein